jgi:8-oxo-dGTP diphosphatase
MAGRARRLAGLLPSYARTLWEGVAGRPTRGGGPRRVVQAVIRSEAGILLSVRNHLRGWELPGGAPRDGEDDEAALRREVREETGLDVVVERRVGEYIRSGVFPHRAVVFACRLAGGSLRPSRETPRLRWFPTDALPDTLFPWFRAPVADALAAHPRPVERREHQGAAAIAAGAVIDLRMRLTDDEAR